VTVSVAIEATDLTHVVEPSRSLVRGNLHDRLVLNVAAVVGFLLPAYFIAERAIFRRLVR
jgi:hypothetical protein